MNVSRSSCLHPLAKNHRHHLLTSSLGKSAARNQAAKSDKKRQRICRNLSLQLVAFCRLLSLVAQLVFNEQFAILDRGTPYPLLNQGFYGSLKSRRCLRGVPQARRRNGWQDILRSASRNAYPLANAGASNVANRAAKPMLTIC